MMPIYKIMVIPRAIIIIRSIPAPLRGFKTYVMLFCNAYCLIEYGIPYGKRLRIASVVIFLHLQSGVSTLTANPQQLRFGEDNYFV